MRPPTDPDLITLHAAAVALARSMRGEPDARRFVEGLSPHLREVIPHDRLLLIREDETPVPSPASWLTLPLEGVDRAIGSLAIAASAPATYTEAHATTARRIAEMLGPLVENMVLLQKERDRRRRMACSPGCRGSSRPASTSGTSSRSSARPCEPYSISTSCSCDRPGRAEHSSGACCWSAMCRQTSSPSADSRTTRSAHGSPRKRSCYSATPVASS